MKLLILIFACIALASADDSEESQGAPVSIQNNNIGDIVTVDANLNFVLSNNMEANILTAVMALLNQQVVNVGDINGIPIETQETVAVAEPVVAAEQLALPALPELSDLTNLITPEIISKIKGIKVTPEMIEKFKEFVKNVKQTQ